MKVAAAGRRARPATIIAVLLLELAIQTGINKNTFLPSSQVLTTRQNTDKIQPGKLSLIRIIFSKLNPMSRQQGNKRTKKV